MTTIPVIKGNQFVAFAICIAPLMACESVNSFLDSQGNRYCLQAGGLGALVGSAAGAGIGYAVSEDATGALIGAGIGAAAGLLGGCQYGVWIADRRKTYESEQARLNAEFSNAQKTNESLSEMNEKLRKGLAEREVQLAQLTQAGRRDQQTVAAKQRLAKELAENRQGIQQQLQQADSELSLHKRTLVELQTKSKQQVDPGELRQYQERVQAMGQEVAELRQLNQQYARADSRVQRL
jgi:hypothetical protein